MNGFYRGTMDDTDVLYDIVDRERFPTAVRDMVYRLRTPGIHVFIADTKDAIMVYEPAYGIVPWLNGHVYSAPSIRGPKLMEFYLNTGLWIAENTDTEVITVVVPDWLGLKHSMWMANVGFTKQWDILGNMMFTADVTQLPKFEERLKKLMNRRPKGPKKLGET